jgi:uncharacterized protein YkwD
MPHSPGRFRNMFWPLLTSLALLLTNNAPVEGMPSPQLASARAGFQEFEPAYDPRAEEGLLELANRIRGKEGLPLFEMDSDLTKAAREHASAMVVHQQLSHQFPGEPGLAQRLAAKSKLFLQEAAENVAMADSVDRVHDTLMHSPPHRENLLHPSYNVVGIGVVRRGGMLWVVQDFGHSLPTGSSERGRDAVAESVVQARESKQLTPLERHESGLIQAGACAMGRENSVHAPAGDEPPQGRMILRYTTTQPDVLPSQARGAIADRSISGFSVGVCYARSSSYPNGTYWVLLVFY